jgi:hypothetical protein
MSGAEPTDKGARKEAAKDQRFLTRGATIAEVRPRSRNGDGYNHEAIVEYDDGTKSSPLPIATGHHGETRVPRVGEPVLVDWMAGDPPRPYIMQSRYTVENRAPEAEPGEWAVNTGDGRMAVSRSGEVEAQNADGNGVSTGEGVEVSGPGGGESITVTSDSRGDSGGE